MLSFIGAAQVGAANQPSPSIWADCRNHIINDLGLGTYVAQDFLGDYATPAATTTVPGIELVVGAGTTVAGNAASATFGPHVLSLATGATDNNNTGIFFEELGPGIPGTGLGTIVRNSGIPVWFEARVAPTALGDTAFFIGLGGTRAVANTGTTGILADNPSNSAAADLLATTPSAVGFISVQASSAIKTVNAIYRNLNGTLLTTVTPLANVGNASAFSATSVTATQSSPEFPGGTPSGLTAPGNLAANTFVKYGIRFDGYHTVEWYINGVRVATRDPSDTTNPTAGGAAVDAIDQKTAYVPLIALKNGASTALTLNVDWIRAGIQLRR